MSGGLIGAVLAHLATPILALGSSRVVRAREIGLWMISAVAALLTLYPRALFMPLVDNKDTYTTAVAILVPVLLIGYVVTQVHLLISTVTLGRELIRASYGRRDLAVTVVVSGVGLLLALAALLPTNRLAWTGPPLTLPASVLGLLVLLGLAVPIVRGALSPNVVGASAPVFATSDRRWLLVPIVLVLTLWAWRANDLLPEGVWTAGLVVETDGTSVLTDPTLAHDVLRSAQDRTGIRGNGERFVVRYGKGIVEDPYNARTRYLPDGRILIMLNSGLPEDRQRNFLGYQFANDLIRLKFLGIDPVISQGYAYWAAENSLNLFLVGFSNTGTPAVACEAATQMHFEQGEVFYSPVASLPFVMAEQRSGLRGVQNLLLDMVDTNVDVEAFRALVASDCATLMLKYVAPPEIVIEAPSDRPDLADPKAALAALAEAKSRTGLDALGAQFVVRYATPRGGLRGDMDFSDPGKMIITLIPSMPAEERRVSLITYFVGAFVTINFGNDVEPARSGFSSWAARDPTNPFLVGRNGNPSPQGACDYLPQADFKTARSIGATWLSSLPFILAERAGGEAAARDLIVELFDQGPIDREAWRVRVRADCARYLGAAR